MTAPPSRARGRRFWRAALATAAVAAVGRLALAAVVPLFPDETYYWEWSRRLAGGYFDHPPAIALLIRFGTTLLGDTPLGVRAGAVLAGAVATFAAVVVARRLAGDRAALLAALLLACLPIAAAGLVLATPDAPLLCAAALAVAALERAIASPPGSRAAMAWWIAAGVGTGAACCAKYTAILLPAAVVVAFALRPSLWARLTEPGPWLAGGAAALVFLPVLRWNAEHDWISFRFQLHHGLAPSQGSLVGRELALLGGQAGLASPILFVLLLVAVAAHLRPRSSQIPFTLAVVAAVPLAFFVCSATRRPVEPNWPAPALIAAVPLLAALGAAPAASARLRGWLRAGVVLGATLVLIVYAQALYPVLPVAARRDPLARAAGWDTLARSVDATRSSLVLAPGARAWVAADRYQDASELAFHLRPRGVVFSLNLGGRPNQYDLWPRFPDLARAGDALVVALDAGEDHPVIRVLRAHFARIGASGTVRLARRDEIVTARRIWILEGWRGTWPRDVADQEAAPGGS